VYHDRSSTEEDVWADTPAYTEQPEDEGAWNWPSYAPSYRPSTPYTPAPRSWSTAPVTVTETLTAPDGRTYTTVVDTPISDVSIPVTYTYVSHGRTYTVTTDEPISTASFPVTHTTTNRSGQRSTYTVEEPVTEIIESSPSLVDDGYWGSWGEKDSGLWNHHSEEVTPTGEWVSYYTPAITTTHTAWEPVYTPYDTPKWTVGTTWKPETATGAWAKPEEYTWSTYQEGPV